MRGSRRVSRSVPGTCHKRMLRYSVDLAIVARAAEDKASFVRSGCRTNAIIRSVLYVPNGNSRRDMDACEPFLSPYHEVKFSSSSASPFLPSAHVSSSFLHPAALSPSLSPPPRRSRPPAYSQTSAAKRFPAPALFIRLDRAPVAAAVDFGTSHVEPTPSANPLLPHVHHTGPHSHA